MKDDYQIESLDDVRVLIESPDTPREDIATAALSLIRRHAALRTAAKRANNALLIAAGDSISTQESKFLADEAALLRKALEGEGEQK